MKTQQTFNIKITNTNLIIDNQNFLLANLITAKYEKKSKSTPLPFIALLGSLFLFFFNPQLALLSSLFGIGWVFNSVNYEYELIIHTKQGEQKILSTKNKEQVEEISSKINKVLVQRKRAINFVNF